MGNNETGEDDFQKLLRACFEISAFFPDGIIFIGGIAVYLHAINHADTKNLAETTHDADFYISLADMADLRDIEEVVPNRRLSKHQLRKYGFEFDIYTERHANLIVPYDQVAAFSIVYDQIRVANLEHLLVLKLEAFRDREKSAKGSKDAKDLIRISLIAQGISGGFDCNLVIPYLHEEHLALLENISRGPEFLSLARGNAKFAKELRVKFGKLADKIAAAFKQA